MGTSRSMRINLLSNPPVSLEDEGIRTTTQISLKTSAFTRQPVYLSESDCLDNPYSSYKKE